MKFLLIEDDEGLAASLQKILESHRYLVDVAADGEVGCNLAEAFAYDLILLDWMLPKLSGLNVCRQLRAQGNSTPIILISARDNKADRVAGLDAGADDYLVKPFEPEELLARIRAALRRANGNASPILQWGDLQIDPLTRGVTYGEQSIFLTPKEYGLLELFVSSPRRIFSLENLLDKVWPCIDTPYVGAVRTHVKGLRQKLKNAGLGDVVETVYGLGYRLTVNPPCLTETASVPSSNRETASTNQLAKRLGKTPETSLRGKSADKSKKEQDPYNLSALWKTVQASYIQRVGNLEKTLEEFSPGIPSEALRQQIIAEAHTLAGSLGSFRLLNVTAHCKEIEQLLHVKKRLNEQDIYQLKALITQVQREISQPLGDADTGLPMETSELSSKATTEGSLENVLEDASSTAKLLVVDDDPAILALLKQILQPWGFKLQLLDNPQFFWVTLEKFVPDLIILDVEMPEVSGLELCQALRNNPRWYEVPILFLTVHTNPETIQKVFSMQADDYLRKPVMVPELVARVLSWVERSRARKLRSNVDNLTGLANQKKGRQVLSRLLQLARRQNKSLCFALISFDDFKAYTKQYGQATSDYQSQKLGALLQSTFREEDVIARWSREALIVGLYGIGLDEANRRLVDLLKAWKMQTIDEDAAPTLSAGIALYPDDATDLKKLYQVAQDSLHQAQLVGGYGVFPTVFSNKSPQESSDLVSNEDSFPA